MYIYVALHSYKYASQSGSLAGNGATIHSLILIQIFTLNNS